MTDDLMLRVKDALSDRYEVESELDRGGMAVVYLARDLRHDRKVAIKVLLPSLSETLGTERFLREIDVIAKLEHPNILTLIDSGEVEGLPYYVMPYVKGQSLAAFLKKEEHLPLEDAVRIACEVAEALETAHALGIIHRDIKPSNVLLSGGHAVVADFGIAGALDESKLSRITRTGLSLGSPMYVSPEQASGERELDGRTDIYSLGCLLYEMLGGKAPFQGSLQSLVSQKVLGKVQPLKEIRPDLPSGITEAVMRAMSTDREDRFKTATEFRAALRSGMPNQVTEGWSRKRTMAAVGAVLAVAVIAVVMVVQNRREAALRVWAAQTLAEVEDLADAGALTEALELAEEVEAAFPGDTTLSRLYAQFTFTIPIRSDPSGARVYVQDLKRESEDWEFLGTTPVEDFRFAGVPYTNEDGVVRPMEDHPHRLRFELDGYRTREIFKTVLLAADTVESVRLFRSEELPAEMVVIPGFTWRSEPQPDFFMDRYEVTNREFEAFIDAGGYRSRDLWRYPFIENGKALSFEEAIGRFRDQTGQPGPSTWRLGAYPEGQGDFPVSGVSWYEAAAYADFAGKELPATYQWYQARSYYRQSSHVIVPRSNLGSDGPRPVGQNAGMTTLGVYDMIGNVREWCFNEVGEGERATLGGAWTDAPFYTGWVVGKPPMDRNETNGIRLVRTFDSPEFLEVLRSPVSASRERDYVGETPASDRDFGLYRRFYEYDPFPLNAVVEQVDTFTHWVREKVAFDLPYGERGGAALYLPRSSRFQPPYQVVLFWGGAGLMNYKSIEDEWTPGFDFMVRSGRVVAVPLFKGAYERDDPLFSTTYAVVGANPGGTVYRDYITWWVKDLSTTIDYLVSREDVDPDRLAYYGFSFGGWTAPIALAVDQRMKVAVTNVGGLTYRRHPPEGDPINFVTRVRVPFLMINGRYDTVFQYQLNQLPMFELLGTPAEDKYHFLSESSHMVSRDDVIRETLAWYDKYLGVPGG